MLVAAAIFAAFTSLVDTFVGTSGTPIGGPIDTFPGADVPFGMVQWSPDTPSQNAGGGYEYSDRAITGFSLTHLSGPGCSVFGDFAILPAIGPIPNDPSTLRQPFSHASEVAAPGWYAVSLGTPAIRAELGVTPRTGIGRFTFPATTQANLFFNAASNQAGVTDAHVAIDGNDGLSGRASSGFFCGMPDRYTVYFAARFDRPFRQSGTYAAGGGAWVSFDATRRNDVVVKVGLSFVSVAGARANLAAEGTSWNVITVRDRATETWSAMLRRITVTGGTQPERRTFYTALYHVFLHPNLISDVTGDYTGFDGRVHRTRAGHDEYANFSDWDIYRTEVPLLALLAPRETSDMMQSLADAAGQERGWLPRWALVNGPTSVMGGDSVDPVIAGAYAFGARDFDARSALAAMVKGASTTAGPPGQDWYVPRWELDNDYLQRGYVVNTHTTSVSPGPNGASETLEYAYDDFSIARLASALHEERTSAAFMQRSSNWKTLFDTVRESIAPRDADGAFMHAPITENGESGFQEGNAAQYTWMVPQDLRDLIAAMGGPAAALAKLDAFFSQLNAGQDKPYAWLGNEPSLGTPWIYLSVGQPWRAQEIVRRALTTLFADTPDGLPGNDDLGTMSAWYVWCAIGLYPQNPAVRYLDVGAPLFTSVTLRAPGSPTIAIVSPRSSDTNLYVAQLSVNGRRRTASWLPLPLHGSVRLDVGVTGRPNTAWAAGSSDAPPSYATTRLATPASTGAALITPASIAVNAGGARALDFTIANAAPAPATVTWQATAPRGLELAAASGSVTVPAGSHAAVSTRIIAGGTLSAGYYGIRIDARAANGALVEHRMLPVRVDNGGARPRIAYAQNRFGNTITPIDLTTGYTGPDVPVGEEPRDAVLSSDGTRLYVANLGGNSISVVDTNRLQTMATIKTGSGPNGLALEPDGRTLWVANSGDATIQPIDTATLVAGAPLTVGANPKAIAIARDGSMLFVSNNGSDTVTPVELRWRRIAPSIASGKKPSGVAISADGNRLYVADSADNDVMVIDLGGRRSPVRIPTGVYPMQIAIAPGDRIAYVTNYANSTVTPIDLATQHALPAIAVGGAPYGVAITSDGRTAVVVSHRDDDCVLIDVQTGRVSRPVPLGIGPYTVAAP